MLTRPRHEQFAQMVARGRTGKQAYAEVFGGPKGADQSASRLLRNAKVRARVVEIGSEIAQNLQGESIRERNFRLQALQKRWELLNQVVEQRGQDPSLAKVPGGKTGLLCRDYKGLGALQ